MDEAFSNYEQFNDIQTLFFYHSHTILDKTLGTLGRVDRIPRSPKTMLAIDSALIAMCYASTTTLIGGGGRGCIQVQKHTNNTDEVLFEFEPEFWFSGRYLCQVSQRLMSRIV